MHEAEIELGLGSQPQRRERRVIGVVGAVARHRHVDPVQRPSEAGGERVGDLHELARVARLLVVAMLHVAVAEVVTELDVGGHLARQAKQPLEDAALDVVEPHREHALEHAELEVRVPLDRELIVRHLVQHQAQLRQQARLVRRLERALMLGDDERADRRQRRRQADLKATADGHAAIALEPREHAIRRDRRVRVAEGLEAHILGARAVFQTHARQRPPAVGRRRHHLEPWLRGEHGQLPHDPVGARAGFTVGNPPQSIAELARERREHRFRVGEGNTADEVRAARRHGWPRIVARVTISLP